MKLTLEQIKSITCGAAEVTQTVNTFSFRRFTDEQSDCYKKYRGRDFCAKTFSGSGIRLAFRTDAVKLEFDFALTAASSRMYGWFDIYENGVMIAHVGGEGKLFSSDHAEVQLSDGEKEIEIYLPWSKAAHLNDFELDGSFVTPIKRSRKLLCYGDSITHGYDAQYPSLTYVSRLARALDAEEYNRAIGGDVFFPELLDETEIAKPDIVTVAYGTNDWNNQTREKFESSCRSFYEKICELYPDAEKFAITPIWREDNNKETKFGLPHTEVERIMRELLADLPVKVIGGYPLTPHVTDFFSDKYLHPNDLGFGEYAERLLREISAG